MMPTSQRRISLVLLALAMHVCEVRASDAEVPMFSFSGFGTLGAVHSSEDRADFTGTQSKPNGTGFTRSWSGGVDSLVSGQVSANLGPKAFAVLQVISEQNPDGTYRPHVEWANLELPRHAGLHDPRRTDGPARADGDRDAQGRLRQPWVRPPVEVYSLVPLTTVDGFDASYYLPAGAGSHRFQVATGRADSRYPDGEGGTTVSKARQDVTIADTYEQGFLTLRVNAGRARITIDSLNPLFNAFRAFGPKATRSRTSTSSKASSSPSSALAGPTIREVVRDGRVGAPPGRQRFHQRQVGLVRERRRSRGDFTPYMTYARARANNLSDPGSRSWACRRRQPAPGPRSTPP
jgi:hypothetical protein